MELVYLGHSAFLLRLPRGITVVTDPYEKLNGLLMRAVKAEVVTISHQHRDHNSRARIQGEPFVISAPGEYETAGVRITGFPSFHDKEKGEKRGRNTIYLIKIDQIKICHLGDLGHLLTEKLLEELNDIDVLLVPVGGVYTINSQEAVKLCRTLQPKIVIPMHYNLKDYKQSLFSRELEKRSVTAKYRVKALEENLAKLETPENFLKELGVKTQRGEKKLILKRGNLPEETEVVLMEKS